MNEPTGEVASRHNIYGRLPDGRQWYIVNLLSGEADLLDASESTFLQSGELSQSPLAQRYREKGYLVDPEQETLRYRQAYLDFLENRHHDEVQLFFVPHYECNFACDYCFQETYRNDPAPLKDDLIDAFFVYVDDTFADRRKYLTIFGGEPLLPSATAHANLDKILDRADARQLGVAIVTNGYSLLSYLPRLRQSNIREIQITLDGPAWVHDKRRHLKGGQGTFQKIVQGIDAALEGGMTVNLRAVLDRDNLPHLPELAQFAIQRGWTQNPGFKTQLGRNYELHNCQVQNSRLYDRLQMYVELHKLLDKHPEIAQFHRPAFSVSRYLFDNGGLPEPLFDACPGTKTEWAFDYQGKIYACTATVGKHSESLGRFYPVVELDHSSIEVWEDRDTAGMEACQSCNLQLACGGGCAAVAKNRHGSIDAPDCRPVDGLLPLGIDYYFHTDTDESSSKGADYA